MVQTYLLGTGDLERFLVTGSAFNLSSCGFRDLVCDVFVAKAELARAESGFKYSW